MNTKLALSAIFLFAVTLGIGMFPAALAKADTTICHFAEEEIIEIDVNGDGTISPDEIFVEEAHWMFLTLNNNGAVNGHLKNHGEDMNGDGVIDDDEKDFIVNDAVTTAACQALIDG